MSAAARGGSRTGDQARGSRVAASTRAWLSLTLLLPLAAPLRAQEAGDSAAAHQAAVAWLQLLDDEEYQVTLDSAAPLLRQMTGSVERWEQFVEMARPNVAVPVERRLVLVEADVQIPGAPPGRYTRLTFEMPAVDRLAVETVVVQQMDDGWRVAMYGVRGG